MRTQNKSYSERLKNRSKISMMIRHVFIKNLATQFKGKVLDIGCGIGEFLKFYGDSIGLEYNYYLSKYCYDQGLVSHVGSVMSLPYRSNAFDGVLLSNVIEHLEQAELGFQEAVRVVKPNGIIVVTCPFEAGFRYDPTHIRFFTKGDLIRLGRVNNIRPHKLYSFPFGGEILGKLLYFFELRAVYIKL